MIRRNVYSGKYKLNDSTKKFYKGKFVLITGGTGFIGTHIVQELLKTDAELRVTVHKHPLIIKNDRIETIYADLTKRDDCLKAVKGVDFVFHAAGTVTGVGVKVENMISNITNYLTMTAQLLQSGCDKNVKRFLIFSSSTGYPAVDHPVREEEMWSGPPHPSYFGYGWMRRYLERLGEFIALKSNMKIAIVRPTAVYGRYDNFNSTTSHVIPALIRKAVEKNNPYEVWGSGEEVRDFVYATDLAQACLLMLEKNASCNPINIGSGKSYKIKEIVSIILKAAGHKNAKVVFNTSMPTTIPFRAVDISNAKEILGWSPKVSLIEGIKRTITWYKKTFYEQKFLKKS